MNNLLHNLVKNLEHIKNNRYTKLKGIQSNIYCQQHYIRYKKEFVNLELFEIYKKIILDRKVPSSKPNQTEKNKYENTKREKFDKKSTYSEKTTKRENKTTLNLSSNTQKNNKDDTLFKSRMLEKTDNTSNMPLFENYLQFKIKHIEPILFGVITLIYDKFIVLEDNQKSEFLKALKFKLGIELDKKDLYNKFNYNKKRYKKADFQYKLVNNDINIGERFYHYLADYFNINIIQINNNKVIECYNDYSESRHCIVLYFINGQIEIQYNYVKTSIISPDQWNKYKNTFKLKESFEEEKKILTGMKLSEVRSKAANMGIVIDKKGKNKMKSKTKKELIDEIEKCIMNS